MPPSTPSRPLRDERPDGGDDDGRNEGRNDGPGDDVRHDAPPVILLVAQGPRRSWLLPLIDRIDPRCQVETASSPGEASSRLTAQRADLLVLDLAFDPEPSHALILHLARLSPSTLILAFGDAATRQPNPARHGWPWDDAEAVLGAAIRTIHRTRRATPSAP